MTTSPVERAADSFAAELARWRVERGHDQEATRRPDGLRPVLRQPRRGAPAPADRGLRPARRGGARRRRRDLAAIPGVRRAAARPRPASPRTATRRCPSSGCRRAPASSSSRRSPRSPTTTGAYRCVIRRALYNAGTEPVTRYLVRIAVDRYPHDPARLQPAPPRAPADLRRAGPARRTAARATRREPMQWRPKLDRDASKEVWLLFENAQRPVPALSRASAPPSSTPTPSARRSGGSGSSGRSGCPPAGSPYAWTSRSTSTRRSGAWRRPWRPR